MVTYSDLFTFVIMLCAVITLVLHIKSRKKQRPRSGKLRRYSLAIYLPAARLNLAFGSLVKYIIRRKARNCNLYLFSPSPSKLKNMAYLCMAAIKRQLSEFWHIFHCRRIYKSYEMADFAFCCLPAQIYLSRQPLDVLQLVPSLAERSGFMVTYSDLFSFVVMLCTVITLVSNYRHKKQPSCPGKLTATVGILPGRVKCTHPPAVLLSILYAFLSRM